MKVRELIEKLQLMPMDADVLHLWDGEARTAIEFVWLSQDGNVISADFGMVCYSDETRPVGAPTKAQDMYWKTPEAPQDDEDA